MLKIQFCLHLIYFLLPADEFIKKFEKLKNKLGNDYIDKLGEDISLIEIMYEDQFYIIIVKINC